DCYAIALMGHASLPTAPMGKLLLAIAHDDEAEDKQRKRDEPTASANQSARPAPPPAEAGSAPASAPQPAPKAPAQAKAEAHPVWSLLSSHPDTVQRATELEQGHAPHCPR
ncbi:MAG: peptidase M48, partial [Acidovorax sp.]|nr:peptidase M48 [Acidovorax sp.]